MTPEQREALRRLITGQRLLRLRPEAGRLVTGFAGALHLSRES